MKLQDLLENEELPYGCKYWSDVDRADIIKTHYEAIQNLIKTKSEDLETYLEEPNTDELLDPYNGYEKQTYVQYNPKDKTISVYEGWSKLCWDALYQKAEYVKGKRKMPKEEAIRQILDKRFPLIAKAADMTIVDASFWFEDSWTDDVESGYIMKVTLKPNK